MNSIETDDVFTSALQTMAQQLEADIHTAGFDQPAWFFGVKLVDSAAALAAAKKHNPDYDAEAPTAGMSLAMQVEVIELQEAHPYDALKAVGNSLSDEVVAVILITEGWSYSAANRELIRNGGETPFYPPSEDPDRVEMRLVNVVGRDGTTVCLRRERGGELEPAESSGGRIVNAMRRTLGVASEAPRPEFAITIADCDRRLKARMLLTWLTNDYNEAFAHINEHGNAVKAFTRQWEEASPFRGVLTWDALLERLRDEPDAASQMLGLDRKFIEWADGGMLSEDIDRRLAGTHAASQRFKELSHQNQWPDDFVSKIKAMADVADL